MEWRQCLSNYEVSDTGLVRNKKTKQILTAIPNSSGYLRVQVYNPDKKHSEYVFVHRLVGIAFVPNPYNYPIINHKDCDYLNNASSNLEWCTQLENMQYAQLLGRMESGEDRYNSKLTWDEIKHIRQVYVPHSRQYGTRALARLYGISSPIISGIVNNKRWKRRDDLS